MSADISILPIWKKDATAYERLSELALLARENPEMFEQFAIVYKSRLPNKNVKFRYMDFGTADVFATMGLFEAGKATVWDSSCR
mgnify:CR=1 FL=1